MPVLRPALLVRAGLAVLVLALLAPLAPARAQRAGTGRGGAFVVTLGMDRIAVERFTRTSGALTGFTTSRDVVINGVGVPAGSDTFWTLPSPNWWKLIVNKQTKQWGTEYHADSDLVRIDMTASSVATPEERFTIAITPRGSSDGALQMTWDTTRVSVPIAAKMR